jgi:hypothetical protein
MLMSCRRNVDAGVAYLITPPCQKWKQRHTRIQLHNLSRTLVTRPSTFGPEFYSTRLDGHRCLEPSGRPNLRISFRDGPLYYSAVIILRSHPPKDRPSQTHVATRQLWPSGSQEGQREAGRNVTMINPLMSHPNNPPFLEAVADAVCRSSWRLAPHQAFPVRPPNKAQENLRVGERKLYPTIKRRIHGVRPSRLTYTISRLSYNSSTRPPSIVRGHRGAPQMNTLLLGH